MRKMLWNYLLIRQNAWESMHDGIDLIALGSQSIRLVQNIFNMYIIVMYYLKSHQVPGQQLNTRFLRLAQGGDIGL